MIAEPATLAMNTGIGGLFLKAPAPESRAAQMILEASSGQRFLEEDILLKAYECWLFLDGIHSRTLPIASCSLRRSTDIYCKIKISGLSDIDDILGSTDFAVNMQDVYAGMVFRSELMFSAAIELLLVYGSPKEQIIEISGRNPV